MKALELFAGGGGLAVALSQTGFETTHVVEWDQWACKTLSNNRELLKCRHEGPIEPTDIRAARFADFEGHVDIVTGGLLVNPSHLVVSIKPMMISGTCSRRQFGRLEK